MKKILLILCVCFSASAMKEEELNALIIQNSPIIARNSYGDGDIEINIPHKFKITDENKLQLQQKIFDFFQQLKNKKCKRVETYVYKDRASLIDIYKNLGFVEAPCKLNSLSYVLLYKKLQ